MPFQITKNLRSHRNINYKISKMKYRKNFSLELQKNEKYELVVDLKNPKFIVDSINIEENSKYDITIDRSKNEEDIKIKEDKFSKYNSNKNKNKKNISNEMDDIEHNKKNKKRKSKQNDDEYYEDDPFINGSLDDSDKTSYSNLEWSIMRPKTTSLSTNRKNGQQNKKKNLQNKDLKIANNNIAKLDNIINLPITISSNLSIADFSELTKIPEHEIIKFLFIKGIQATVNQIIDIETAKLVADQFEVDIIINEKNAESINQNKEKEKEIIEKNDLNKSIETLEVRAPIVAILGHVDHGKTTLLDKIRQSNVANREAGGITQRLAAYEVFLENENDGNKIVFLDTPGHKAFSAMRSRGASLTDISVLIVAADDGVQPQTIEALKQIQNTNSELIVAVNKIDKPSANIQNVTNELTKYNVVNEKLGGDTKFIEISAKQGINIDLLLKSIIDIAKNKQLYANPKAKAQGIIIESHLDKSKGPITTILVQNGTLNVGDICLTSTTYGRVRAMITNGQNNIKYAGPSSVVEVLGLAEIANVGDSFKIVQKEKEAKSILGNLKNHINLDELSGSRISITSGDQKQKNKKIFSVIIKADTQGSLEAILDCLKKIPQSKIQIGLINANLGDIKETDIEMADTTGSIIIAFNAKMHNSAKSLASKHKISIEYFNVIYDLLEFVENTMKDMIEPEFLREEIGEALVKNIFNISKGTVAGCFINKGKLIRGCNLQVIRNNEKVFEGTLDSLKQVKNDIYELEEGNECGIVVNNYQEWNKNDMIKAYTLTPKAPEL